MREGVARLDERALCPTSGQLCVAKAALLEQFGETTDMYRRGPVNAFPYESDEDDWNGEEDMYPRPAMTVSPETDGVKLSLQLNEYAVVARAISCGGPVEGDCPTRIKMIESPARASILKLIRRKFDI